MRSTMPRRCDIVTGLSRQGADVLNQSVDALMTHNVECCSPHDTIAEVMTVMTERRTRHLAVIKGGKLVGLISIGDGVKQRLIDANLEGEEAWEPQERRQPKPRGLAKGLRL